MEITPYELATLASRIYQERCASDPKEAIAAAERLLQEADAAIDRAYQEERTKEWELELEKAPRIHWVQAAKQITAQKRRDRAEQHFLEFIKHESPRKWQEQLNRFRREGLTEYDIDDLQRDFTEWLKQSKRKKGKQGRRISEHDRRLRVGSFPLVPTKSRKRI
jgi:hypothetical protein